MAAPRVEGEIIVGPHANALGAAFAREELNRPVNLVKVGVSSRSRLEDRMVRRSVLALSGPKLRILHLSSRIAQLCPIIPGIGSRNRAGNFLGSKSRCPRHMNLAWMPRREKAPQFPGELKRSRYLSLRDAISRCSKPLGRFIRRP